MKKALAFALSLAMVISLAACGPASSPTESSPSASAAPETSPAAAPSEASGTPTIDPLTFDCNTTFYETDTAGVVTQYFCDQLEELSGGAITCNVSWGGTLYDDASAFDAVRSGAIPMIIMKETRVLDYMPLMGVPPCAPTEDGFGALEYLRTLYFEDPTTSQLFADMCTNQGVKFLNVMTTGENAFAANFEWETLDDLVNGSAAFGAKATVKYEALGLKCAPYGGPEIYDAISRGIIDSANYTIYGAYSMSWYEVAPYLVRDTLWAVGNTTTVNQAWWDSLTDTQRDVIQQAADAATEYSAEYVSDLMDEVCAEYSQKSGVEVKTLNEEDSKRWWEATFTATANDSMKRVAGTENEEAMIEVLTKAAELTGIDWTYQG